MKRNNQNSMKNEYCRVKEEIIKEYEKEMIIKRNHKEKV